MIKRVDEILEHIHAVEKNCIKLGKKLIEQGHVTFGLHLIRNGRTHDLSKLEEFEFQNLDPSSLNFKEALGHHHFHNTHHPEYWRDGIHEMTDLCIAEMVCDCAARGGEFGTDVRKWFIEEATKRYNFKITDKVGIKILYYLDLLLAPPFK